MSDNKIKVTYRLSNPEHSFLSKPVPSLYSIPQWLRDQPSRVETYSEDNPMLTVKRCMPFFDAMTTDFVIKTQFDLLIDFDTRTKRQTFKILSTPEIDLSKNFDGFDFLGQHDVEQFNFAPIPSEYRKDKAFKWLNHWTINTPKGHSLLFSHPHNRFDLPFYTLSGMVDADTFELPVNFPFLIKKNFIGVVPKGTPVVQISIVKKTKWKIQEQESDLTIFEKINDIFFENSAGFYKKRYRYLNKNE